MFTGDDLRTLLGSTARPAVSIYLPTHVKGREIRQDPIRLKNLLGKAEEALTANGMRGESARTMLAPARALLDDAPFWRHQDRGLALFAAPGFFRYHRLPVDVAEAVTVGPDFIIKPLLGLLAEDCRFFVLAISGMRARLFEASRYSFTERRDIALPQTPETVGAEADREAARQAHPLARARAGAAAGIEATHGLGETREELRKSEQIEYLRQVAAVLESEVALAGVPLVIAADSQSRGHFLKLARPRNLVGEPIELNPGAVEPAELHRLALEQARPHFAAVRARAVEQLNVLLGNGDARACLIVGDIVRAAHDGRVGTLFIAKGETLWGRFDEPTGVVHVRGRTDGEDRDLLDYAAACTLLNGGRVDLLARADMPRSALAAAILRY